MESRQSIQSRSFTLRTALGLSALISFSLVVLGCAVTNEGANGEASVAMLEQRLEKCACVPRGYCNQGSYALCTRLPDKGECQNCMTPGAPEACVVRAAKDPCEQVKPGIANPSGLACNDSGQCVLDGCTTCWKSQTTIECTKVKTDCGSGGVICLTCDDGNPCTDLSCSTGICTFPNDDTNLCDDGNGCTTTDHCSSGSCTGTPVSDGLACTTNSKPGECLGGVCCGGCVSGGVCYAGNTPTQCGTSGNDCQDCRDQSQCTNDSCDVATGSCVHEVVNCNDKNACTNDGCSANAGCYNTERNCGDANACTVDSCDPASGCVHSAIVCDDLNPCTNDACDVNTGCTHTPLLGQQCNDADPCTIGDACNAAGECAGALRDCNDANVCTADACLAGSCVYAPIDEGLPCDDGSSCTTDDRCQSGICRGAGLDCTDGNPCTSDACDGNTCPQTPLPDSTPCVDPHNHCFLTMQCLGGACLGGEPVDCDDRDPCTRDACVPESGCTHTPTPGAECDDGNPCTADDTCRAGGCQGEAVLCAALNTCHTVGACDPNTGVCSHPRKADGEGCDDGDPCTREDSCQSGSCRGQPIACTVTNECETCNAGANSCLPVPRDDGEFCTLGICRGGVCRDPNAGGAAGASGTPTSGGAGGIETAAGGSAHVAGAAGQTGSESDAVTSGAGPRTSQPVASGGNGGIQVSGGDGPLVGAASDNLDRRDDVGCGCRTVGTNAAQASGWWLAASAVVLSRLRKRRTGVRPQG